MRYDIASGLSDAEAADLTARLARHNRVRGWGAPGAPEAQPMHVALRSPDGALVGGLVGRTHAIPSWLEIAVLWVDDAARGRGLGRRLVEEAERAARLRGCRFARLATSDAQAPGFYAALGYTPYGMLEDCPPGVTVYYLRKSL